MGEHAPTSTTTGNGPEAQLQPEGPMLGSCFTDGSMDIDSQNHAGASGSFPTSEGTKMSYRDKMIMNNYQQERVNRPKNSLGEGDLVVVKVERGPSITLSRRVHERIDRRWEFSVVVKLLGRSIGYNMLCSKIKTMWAIAEGFKVVDLHNDLFLIKLANQEEVDRALLDGPWQVLGHCLTVQKWDSKFIASKAKVSKIITWICFPELPIQYYDEAVLWGIGDVIGKTVRIEYNTKEAQREKYTRIAVELDLDEPIKPQIKLEGTWYRIEYEGLSQVCFNCGRIGHNAIGCLHKTGTEENTTYFQEPVPERQTAQVNSATESVKNTVAGEGPKFGPWVYVARRNTRQTRVRGSEDDTTKVTGTHKTPTESRFEALNEAEESHRDVSGSNQVQEGRYVEETQKEKQPHGKGNDKMKGKSVVGEQVKNFKASPLTFGPGPSKGFSFGVGQDNIGQLGSSKQANFKQNLPRAKATKYQPKKNQDLMIMEETAVDLTGARKRRNRGEQEETQLSLHLTPTQISKSTAPPDKMVEEKPSMD